MSVQEQITRLSGAKNDIASAIAAKGVSVPSGIKLDGMATLIEGIETGVDTSDATAAAGDMRAGTSAYVNGVKVEGSVVERSEADLTASGATVNVPAGIYDSAVSKSVATATQATPSITVSSAGLITASATQSAGYVAAGTKSATKQLTTKAAATITPTTSDQTIAASTYLTGVQTIKGDANLIAANILSGKSIFGVAGTVEAGGGASGEITISSSYGKKLSLPINFVPRELVMFHTPTSANSMSVIWWQEESSGGMYLYMNASSSSANTYKTPAFQTPTISGSTATFANVGGGGYDVGDGSVTLKQGTYRWIAIK